MSSSQTPHYAQHFVWHDIGLKSAEEHKKFITFLESTFGWKSSSHDVDGLRFSMMAKDDGALVCGLATLGGKDKDGKEKPPTGAGQWAPHLGVVDIDATHKLALELGATELVPIVRHSRGAFSRLADPTGAPFYLWTSSSPEDQKPKDTEGKDSEKKAKWSEWKEAWAWHQLVVPLSQRAKIADFYAKIMGWTVSETDLGEKGGPDGQRIHVYFTRAGDSEPHADVLTWKDEDRPGAKGHWMNYIRVADVDATAKAAVGAGAQVLLEPCDLAGVPIAGRIAVIADIAGGSLVLYADKPKAAAADKA